MTRERACTRCGVALKEFASGGLCPRCLLNSGLGEEENAHSGGAARGSTSVTGRTFGDYELLEEIAHGGMGVVYKARQRGLNRVVAVKLLLAGRFAEARFVQRFRAEAEAAARLQHPNIVAIHEIGENEGYPYFSMDYVDGKNLAQIRHDWDAQGADFRRCARWVKTMAEAVHYAHQRGILHRDLKPANILIDAADEPHITDFGLAKKLDGFETSAGELPLTVTGQVLGSPNYLPPEQAAGNATGPASDVYSLGAILYHLLTGRPPFEADSLTSVLKQVLDTEPVSPRLLNPSIPWDLVTICLRCLEKEAGRRYATAQELAEELGRYLASEPIRARPIGMVGKTGKWCRRQPVRAGLIGGMAMVIFLGMAGVTWQWRRADRERDLVLRHAYAGDMKAASFALEEGNLASAKRLLDKYRPRGKGAIRRQGAESDLRGWEWRYLWGLCRSDEKFSLVQESSSFVNLALTPDGKCFAAQQAGGNIELWDWDARRRLAILTNQGYPPAMALSPDGTIIAAANRDASGKPVVSFWDVGTRRITRQLPQQSAVASMAFSPDGTLLAAFHLGPWCSLWRVASGEWVTNYPAGLAINVDMRVPLFSADSRLLVLGDYRNPQDFIRCIDLQTGLEREIPISFEGNAITAMALSRDGRILASGYGYSAAVIDLWDLHTGAAIGRLNGHRGWVKRLVFSEDGQTLYSGSADQSVRAWNILEKKQRHRWGGHTDLVTGLAIMPGGDLLLSCSQDGSVRVWNTQGPSQPPAHVTLPVRGGPYGAPFTRDSRRLITASATVPVTIWDAATGYEIERLEALGTNHLSVALSPDERWLATGGLDGAIQIWDMERHTVVSRFQAHSKQLPIFAIRFLPGNSLLSCATVPHQLVELKRWDSLTWRELPSGVSDVAGCNGFTWTPDGQRLILAYETGPLKVWDLRYGRLEATFGNESTFMPAVSRDGRLLAAPTFGGRVLVWDLATRREVASLERQVNTMVSAAFSSDGQRLVTGSMVGGELQPAVEVWDFATGRGLLSLRGQGRFTGWTEFSPDGNTLLALSWHGVTELWHAPDWAEIEAEEKGK